MNNTVFHNCNTISVTIMHKYYHFDDIIKVSNRKEVHANLYDHLSSLSNLNHNLKYLNISISFSVWNLLQNDIDLDLPSLLVYGKGQGNKTKLGK